MRFVPSQRVHVIGIGGFGMSAIARILLLRGLTVTGSDRNRGELTVALTQAGAIIYDSHGPEHVQGADMVIATSAVADDHVEIVAARAAGIVIDRRKSGLLDQAGGPRGCVLPVWASMSAVWPATTGSGNVQCRTGSEASAERMAPPQ